jgi:hypothetical protein
MELASMLAGEPFSDRPRSGCRVIGAVLRAYNDRLDDRRRQDLYAYASKVVGTRATAEVERRRIERCLAFARDATEERSRLWRRTRRLARWDGLAGDDRLDPVKLDAMGLAVARSVGRPDDATHRRMLAFIDELIAIGAPPAPPIQLPPLDRQPEPIW